MNILIEKRIFTCAKTLLANYLGRTKIIFYGRTPLSRIYEVCGLMTLHMGVDLVTEILVSARDH